MRLTGPRRAAIAAASLSLSALLFRGFVADALVSRGDEFLRAGDLASSRAYFARAFWIDRDCESAVERFAFASLQLRERSALQAAIAMTGEYLARRPGDLPLRVDRALALYVAGYEREAVPELLRAARESGDFRLYGLAAHAALRAGERTVARSAYRRALAIDPAYRQARIALRVLP